MRRLRVERKRRSTGQLGTGSKGLHKGDDGEGGAWNGFLSFFGASHSEHSVSDRH